MKLADLATRLDLKVFAGKRKLDRPVAGGYAGDLLSDVMAHAGKDDLWVTIQVHPNIVAVAVLKELAGIVLVNGREPAAETIERAEREGLPIVGAPAAAFDIIAITDHNSAENAAAVAEAAAGTGLTVLPGLELASEEEAHILGLFEAGADLGPLLAVVYENLPDVPSKRSFIKDQVIVDAEDGVTGFNPRCLIGATQLTLYEAVRLIHGHGGLAIASHIDREAFSVISQLGFIPPDLELDAVEVSPLITYAQARAAFGPLSVHPLVRFSDAHRPEEIGRATMELLMARPSLEEIRKALAGREGREARPS